MGEGSAINGGHFQIQTIKRILYSSTSFKRFLRKYHMLYTCDLNVTWYILSLSANQFHKSTLTHSNIITRAAFLELLMLIFWLLLPFLSSIFLKLVFLSTASNAWRSLRFVLKEVVIEYVINLCKLLIVKMKKSNVKYHSNIPS